MLSDRCPVLSCLPVTLVYCGQTVGWMKMPLGTDIDLGPSQLPRKGAQELPSFRRMSVVAAVAHLC